MKTIKPAQRKSAVRRRTSRAPKVSLAAQRIPPRAATLADDIPDNIALSRDPSEPPSQSGHQIPDRDAPDEQRDTETLVEAGIQAAQQEQTRSAHRHARQENKP